MVSRRVMKPTTRMVAEHLGQTSGSSSYTLRSRSAQRLRSAAAAGDGGACCPSSASAQATRASWSRLRFPLAALE